MKVLNERNGFSKLLKMCLAAALCVGILPALPSIAFAGEKQAAPANSEASTLTYKTSDGTFTNEDGETVDAPTGFTSDATDHSKVTLQNFNFTSTAAVGIQFDADITMTLVGANSLTVNSAKSGNNGAGFLFMSKDGDTMTYHSFVLKGTNQASDSLTINYTNNQANTYNMGGFICTKFSQTSCTLTSNTTTSSTSDGVSAYGIWAQNGIESIASSTLNCTCKNTGESTGDNPFHLGSAIRNGCGGEPLGKATAVDSSTINATCYISQTNAQAICTSNDMTFTNSTVKATLQKGSTSAREVYGIACPQDMGTVLTNNNSTIDVQIAAFSTTQNCFVFGMYFENGYTQTGSNASTNINIGTITSTAEEGESEVVGFDVKLRDSTTTTRRTSQLSGGKFISNVAGITGEEASADSLISDILNVENCAIDATAGSASDTSRAVFVGTLNMNSGTLNAKSGAAEDSLGLSAIDSGSNEGVCKVVGGSVYAESGSAFTSYAIFTDVFTQTGGFVVGKAGVGVGLAGTTPQSVGFWSSKGPLQVSGGYLSAAGNSSVGGISTGIGISANKEGSNGNEYTGGLIYTSASTDAAFSAGIFCTGLGCKFALGESCGFSGSLVSDNDIMATVVDADLKEVSTESNAGMYAYVLEGTTTPAVTTVAHGPAYGVEIADAVGGTVSSKYVEYYEGLPVELVVAPASGYKLDSLSVTQVLDGTQVALAGTTFIMPAADVAVAAKFSVIDNGSGGGSDTPALLPASDTAQTGDNNAIALLLGLTALASAGTLLFLRKCKS